MPPSNSNATLGIKAGPIQIGKKNKDKNGKTTQGSQAPPSETQIIMAQYDNNGKLVETETKEVHRFKVGDKVVYKHNVDIHGNGQHRTATITHAEHEGPDAVYHFNDKKWQYDARVLHKVNESTIKTRVKKHVRETFVVGQRVSTGETTGLVQKIDNGQATVSGDEPVYNEKDMSFGYQEWNGPVADLQAVTEEIKKGAFHKWLGKSTSDPITDKDIQKGLAAGGHAAKMANFARNMREETINEAMPLKGHPYHYHSNDMLHHIIKDAGEASHHHDQMHGAMKYNKYADQVNDAASILHYRLKYNKQPKKEKPFRDAAVTGSRRDFANEDVIRDMGDLVPTFEAYYTTTKGPSYSKDAVDKAIASHNRHGKKIGGREAKLIHRLLKGRHEVGTTVATPKPTNENYADWHETMEKKGGSGEGQEVQFKIKNAGGRTEAHHGGKKIGHYDHTARKGHIAEGVHEHDILKDHTKNPYHSTLTQHGFVHHSSTHHGNHLAVMGSDEHDFTRHVYTHPDHGKSLVSITQYHHPGTGHGGRSVHHSFIHRHQQSNGIMAPSTGENKNQLHRALSREYGVPKNVPAPKLTAWEKKSGHTYKMNEGKIVKPKKKGVESKSKEDMKRKYIGKTRGTTATGKPAHQIVIDPIVKVDPSRKR